MLKQNSADSYTIQLKPALLGGKGGFGSLLRSIKPGKKAVENFDACRDLTTGRRLGQIQQQERITEWQDKKQKEDKYVEEELQKYQQAK